MVHESDVSQNGTVIGSHYIFTAKQENGLPVRAKARLVANGDYQTREEARLKKKELLEMERVCVQSQELDLDRVQGQAIAEHYAPVVGKDALRIGIAHAVQEGMYITAIDVKAAFLHAKMDERDPPIYLVIPPFMEPEEIRQDHYYRLKKSLYGLRQAPKMWFEHLAKWLKDTMHFTQSAIDPCIFCKTDTPGQRIHAYVYVDDIVLCADRQEEITTIRDELDKIGCETTGGEAIDHVLKLDIDYNREEGVCTLNQAGYCRSLERQYEPMFTKHQRDLPAHCVVPLLEKHKRLPQLKETTSNERYRSVIGSLQYLAICTRPDIAYAVSYLSRFLTAYSTAHVNAALHVLRYVIQTPKQGIIFKKQPEKSAHVLIGYVDAGFVGDAIDSKCQHGYMMLLNGGPVTWKSGKQPIVAMSTAEAEYIAASYAIREIVYLRQILEDIGIPQQKPTRLNEDNQAAIAIARAKGQTQRTKHILRHFHYVREAIDCELVKLNFCETSRQLADMFTKILNRAQLEKLLRIMTTGSEMEFNFEPD